MEKIKIKYFYIVDNINKMHSKKYTKVLLLKINKMNKKIEHYFHYFFLKDIDFLSYRMTGDSSSFSPVSCVSFCYLLRHLIRRILYGIALYVVCKY